MNGLSTSNNGNGHHPRSIITEYHCQYCGRRLFDAYLPPGTKMRIRCFRSSCKRVNVFGFVTPTPQPAPVVELATGGQA